MKKNIPKKLLVHFTKRRLINGAWELYNCMTQIWIPLHFVEDYFKDKINGIDFNDIQVEE
jgi:hypothetical protein